MGEGFELGVGDAAPGGLEDGRVHGRPAEGACARVGVPEVDQRRHRAVGQEPARQRIVDEPRAELPAGQRPGERLLSVTQEAHLGHAKLGSREEREEPGLLRRAGARDPDRAAGEVPHGARRRPEGGRHRQDGWRRRREGEHDVGRLAGLGHAEAEGRLHRGRREVGLLLGQRLGRAGVGARRPERDQEAGVGEIPLGRREPEREIFR